MLSTWHGRIGVLPYLRRHGRPRREVKLQETAILRVEEAPDEVI